MSKLREAIEAEVNFLTEHSTSDGLPMSKGLVSIHNLIYAVAAHLATPDDEYDEPPKVYRAWTNSNHNVQYTFGYFETREQAEECLPSRSGADPEAGVEEITIIQKPKGGE